MLRQFPVISRQITGSGARTLKVTPFCRGQPHGRRCESDTQVNLRASKSSRGTLNPSAIFPPGPEEGHWNTGLSQAVNDGTPLGFATAYKADRVLEVRAGRHGQSGRLMHSWWTINAR